jgi:hypothetical protein
MGYGFGVVSVAFLFDGVLNGRYSKIGVECGVRDNTMVHLLSFLGS